ncbi:MAG TPA: Fic family protein [Pseudobdellovibrionaceae bacterium]
MPQRNVAAAHQRFSWIHSFLDGNGRVVRLFSDCFFMKENLGGVGLVCGRFPEGLQEKNNLTIEHSHKLMIHEKGITTVEDP